METQPTGSDPDPNNHSKSARRANNNNPIRSTTTLASPDKRRMPANQKGNANGQPAPARAYSPSEPVQQTQHENSRAGTPTQQTVPDYEMQTANTTNGAIDEDDDYETILENNLTTCLEDWRDVVSNGGRMNKDAVDLVRQLAVIAKLIPPLSLDTNDVFMDTETDTSLHPDPYPSADRRFDQITQTLAILTKKVEELSSTRLPTPLHHPASRTDFPTYSNAVKTSKKKLTPKTSPKPTTAPVRQQPSPTRNNAHRVLLITEPTVYFNQIDVASTTLAVNAALEKNVDENHKHYRFLGMQPTTNSGRPVFITAPDVTADEMLRYREVIIRAIPPPNGELLQEIDVQADKPRYLVAVQGVKRKTDNRNTTPEDIEKALKMTMGKSNYTLATPPRFLIPNEGSKGADKGTILISFSDEISADLLLMKGVFWFNCERCSIRRFNDRPPVTYCDDCHSLKHRAGAKQCHGKLCEQCGAKEHDTTDHPLHAEVKCANCGGAHTSRSKECPLRRNPFALRKTTIAKKTSANKKSSQ